MLAGSESLLVQALTSPMRVIDLSNVSGNLMFIVPMAVIQDTTLGRTQRGTGSCDEQDQYRLTPLNYDNFGLEFDALIGDYN